MSISQPETSSSTDYVTGRKKNSYDNKWHTVNTQTEKYELTSTYGNWNRDNLFMLRKNETEGGLLNGSGKGVLTTTFEDYPCDRLASSRNPALLPMTPWNILAGYKQMAWARTGLDQPVINLPRSLLELKDVPRMLKHASGLLTKAKNLDSPLDIVEEIASGTLAYQFGWKPIIDDITKILNIMEKVSKDLNRYREMYDSAVRDAYYDANQWEDDKFYPKTTYLIHKRALLYRNHDSVSKLQAINTSSQFNHYADEVITDTTEIWCTTRWIISGRDLQNLAMLDMQPLEIFRKYLAIDPKYMTLTVWKLMPWTWFTDWFYNFSDYITASQNAMDFDPYDGCIMCTKTRTITYPGTTKNYPISGSVRLSDYKRVMTTKQRLPFKYDASQTSWTAIPLKLPIVDDFKVSVLASLGVLKALR